MSNQRIYSLVEMRNLGEGSKNIDEEIIEPSSGYLQPPTVLPSPVDIKDKDLVGGERTIYPPGKSLEGRDNIDFQDSALTARETGFDLDSQTILTESSEHISHYRRYSIQVF